jgi:hypothetical protein
VRIGVESPPGGGLYPFLPQGPAARGVSSGPSPITAVARRRSSPVTKNRGDYEPDDSRDR